MNSKTTYTCDNCGAVVNFKKYERVKECSYCGNLIAIVDSSIDTKGLNKMLPFEITIDEAFKILNMIYPKKAAVLEKVYIPFYVCDFDMIYYAHCFEEKGTGDDRRIIEYKVLIDGSVSKYFKPAVQNLDGPLIGLEYLKKDKIVDYDPLIAGNHTLMNNNFIYYENVIDSASHDICEKIIGCESSSITILSSDSAEINENVDIVLVPFYKVLNHNLEKGYLLAQNIKEDIKDAQIKKILRAFCLILTIGLLVSTIFSYKAKMGVVKITHIAIIIAIIIALLPLFKTKYNIEGVKYKKKKIK